MRRTPFDWLLDVTEPHKREPSKLMKLWVWFTTPLMSEGWSLAQAVLCLAIMSPFLYLILASAP